MALIILIAIIFLLFGTKSGRRFTKKLFAKLVGSTLKIVIYIALAAFVIFLVYHAIVWIFENFLLSVVIAVIAFAGMIGLGMYQDKKDKERHSQILTQWKSKPVQYFELWSLVNGFQQFISKIDETDTNKVKFTTDFPYGRMSYFLNFFDRALSNDEPLYFSPSRSKDSNELREYGIEITISGIFISFQSERTDKNNNYISKDIAIPFSGMIHSEITGDTLYVYYENYDDSVSLDQKYSTVPLSQLNDLCQALINSGVTRSMAENHVYDYADIIEQQEDEFLARNLANEFAGAFETAGIASSMPQMNNVFSEVMNNMNQRQGHGLAAEYGNTAVSRITGDFRAKHLGGDNALNGADRSIHRLFRQETFIQCKYEKDPTATIQKAFFEHDYDKNMKIEVARDKYKDCRDNLQKRIDKGDLEHKGIKKGDKAENYLKRGFFSYNESHNIAVAGRIEGLAVDAMQGIVCSAGAGSITAILTFATCKWQGMDTKDAAIQSLTTGAKVIGKSTAIFVVTMQLSRKNMTTNLMGMFAKNNGNPQTTLNPVFKISESLAKKISKSSVAKSSLGKKLGLNKTTGKTLISGTVMVAITFGPDILRSLTGRISFKQLIKNSAIGGAGIAGAAIGQTIIPIPVVGSMIGGAVAGFIAKKTLDNFIEDDAIEMFAILKEEFIDIVPLSGLNQEEFNSVVDMTIAHKKLPSLLRDMYAYGDAREYAREKIVNTAVQHTLSQRELISEEMYYDGIGEVVADPA